MVDLLQDIVEILVGGISQVATGIGSGLKNLVEGIFVTASTSSGGETTYALTTFGGLVIIFAGVALAIGLSRWVMNFVTSLGN